MEEAENVSCYRLVDAFPSAQPLLIRNLSSMMIFAKNTEIIFVPDDVSSYFCGSEDISS